jgi:hypothetical protein
MKKIEYELIWEQDDEYVESIREEITSTYIDIKEKLSEYINEKSGDIGRVWVVLRDGNHRTWGAILAGEEFIFCSSIIF